MRHLKVKILSGACAYYGAETAVSMVCSQLGFSDEICGDAGALGVAGVEQYCDSLDGEYGNNGCADVGVDQCTVLTDGEFAKPLRFISCRFNNK